MSAQQKLPQFINRQPSMGLPFEKELVVDLFAGGGGASTGIARAYREPDVVVNHNPIALAVHRANHPQIAHYVADVFEVDPVHAAGGQPVGILWASPDCRHHSKAKGSAPRDRGVRGLAWVVVRWAHAQAVISQCRDDIASPYLVHRKPKRRKQKQAQHKDHWTKIEERYLTRAFKDAREAANCYARWKEEEMPGFHEVRALSLHLYRMPGRMRKKSQVMRVKA